MCEETDREGRGLENKWIYVPLLFVILGGQRYSLNAQLLCIEKYRLHILLRIIMTRVVVVLQVNSNEAT